MRKIFVGGLSPDIAEMDLVIFISNYAEVATIKMVRDKITKKSKGYAFLEMTNPAEAEKAVVALNGRLFKGNKLTVKLSEEAPAKPQANKYLINKKPKR